jgi:hypothetical protein
MELNMSRVQTNNSELSIKVYIRNEILKDKNYKILNCFAGNNEIYKKVNSPNLQILHIDIKNTDQVSLKGNNLKFLSNMDLSYFDIIDLDAYGSPSPQLDILFNKQYKGIVFFTFILPGMGKISNNILNSCGYNNKMISKCPSLFNKNGFDKFKTYLYNNGINEIYYINVKQTTNKYYGYFTI